MLKQVVLARGVRTAIGTFGGAFAEVPAPALGAAAGQPAVGRDSVSLPRVERWEQLEQQAPLTPVSAPRHEQHEIPNPSPGGRAAARLS